jgi:hypothetical protein
MNIQSDKTVVARAIEVEPAKDRGPRYRTRAKLTGAPYGRLVEVCDAFGIPRTKAFEYARAGLLRTFLLGRQRMVYVESVMGLPERLAKDAAA